MVRSQINICWFKTFLSVPERQPTWRHYLISCPPICILGACFSARSMVQSRINICRVKLFYLLQKRNIMVKVVTLHANLSHYIISLSTFLDLVRSYVVRSWIDMYWFEVLSILQKSKDMTKVVTMHANCCTGLGNKIQDLRRALDSWERNKSTPPPEEFVDMWRVPAACRHSKWPSPAGRARKPSGR